MAIVSLNTIKNWFKTGLKPTQQQFWDAWDSFRHKSEAVPYAEIEGLDAVLLEQNNKINALSLPDTVLKTGEIMVNGLNVAIIANGFQWRLNQQSFLDTPGFSRVLSAATQGFKRTDNLEGDDTGNYFIVQGVEDEFAAPAPSTTEGRIVLASIPVFGGAIGAIEISFPNEIETPFTVIDRANRKGISIWPFTISLWKWVSGFPVYLNIFIDNVTEKYDVQFPNKIGGTSQTFAMVSDLDAKLDITDYNNHYKGVYLTQAALISAHPTAIVGDYAQVNEVGATDVVNYNWDAEESIWVKNEVAGSGATNTDALPEGTSNLYFQTARVLATLLTGISFLTGGAIVSTDSVLVAFGKLQKQISDFNTAANIKTLLEITTLSGSNTGDETTTSLKTKIDVELAYACSDEISNLTVGNLISFRVPFAMILSEVRISLNDAPTVSSLVVDVKEGGISILSTLLSIDASELTSVTAAVPAVISDVNLADDALLTVSTTQIGSGNTGKGLKILFKGKKA